MATSQTACEMVPGQTDLYLRNSAPQKSPQTSEAVRSMKLKENMWTAGTTVALRYWTCHYSPLYLASWRLRKPDRWLADPICLSFC